jgi:hypothetical protein
MKNGSEPISSAAATMRPQSAIGTGFFSTVLMEVATAVSAPALRSRSRGNETTLTASVPAAKQKPMKQPALTSSHLLEEVDKKDWRRRAVQRRVEQLRRDDPGRKDRQEERPERRDGGKRGRAQHVKGIFPRDF